MWGLKRKEKVAEVPPELPKRPLAIVPRTTTVQLGTYENLANELGFRPAQLLDEQLKRFLVEQKIPTYNLEEVDKYLTHIARAQGEIWIWRPLRERDKPSGWTWRGHTDYQHNELGAGHGSYQNDWKYRPYDKAVPIHILRRVQNIQEKFGKEVMFFVSDYAAANPDPFIMVTALDVDRIVFGVWDEPSFDDVGAEE